MTESKLEDYLSPLIIDIGSRNVKYTQPLTNASQIMQQIYQAKKALKEKREKYALSSTQMLQLEQEEQESNSKVFAEEEINANTIFDYKGAIHSIPTVNCIYDIEISESNASEYIIELMQALKDFDKEPKYSFDFSGQSDTSQSLLTSPMRFDNEPMYQGIINPDLDDLYQKIIQSIGQRQLDKAYFNEELFAETPLIITQDALPLSQLEEQNQKLFEMFFEDFNAQYVLICSQAMLSMLSYNLSSGIVVDMGESKTSIIPIRNGFACYDKAIHSSFLSGRTISILLAQFKNLNMINSTKISLENFYNAALSKHQSFDKTFEDNSYSYLKYLYSYPELFRSLYRKDNQTSHEYIRAFIQAQMHKDITYANSNSNTNDSTGIVKHNHYHLPTLRVKNPINSQLYCELNFGDWTSGLNKFYLTQSEYTIEKKVFQSDCNYIDRPELSLFRQNSLINLLGYQIEKCLNEEMDNEGNTLTDIGIGNSNMTYSDIVFSGGVLNTPGLKQIIQNDMKCLMLNNNSSSNKNNIHLHFPSDEDDSSIAFYKGANYLAKLNGLKNLMVSRQDYYELGVQGLGYNYI